MIYKSLFMQCLVIIRKTNAGKNKILSQKKAPLLQNRRAFKYLNKLNYFDK